MLNRAEIACLANSASRGEAFVSSIGLTLTDGPNVSVRSRAVRTNRRKTASKIISKDHVSVSLFGIKAEAEGTIGILAFVAVAFLIFLGRLLGRYEVPQSLRVRPAWRYGNLVCHFSARRCPRATHTLNLQLRSPLAILPRRHHPPLEADAAMGMRSIS